LVSLLVCDADRGGIDLALSRSVREVLMVGARPRSR
jgi:hypothetical protein